MTQQNIYRTHTCGEINEAAIGLTVRLAGFVESVRDHGGIQFLDLRDHYGVVQVVLQDEAMLQGVTRESAITVSGVITRRDPDTVNEKIASGTVELRADSLTVLGRCRNNLPFDVLSSTETREEVRLTYRYLDLRNPKVHNKMILRSQVIAYLRQKMTELGFLEMQTPILSVSSPEGARDYLIPSRRHQGKFYALPQAPQIFKQLLMVSGFDRYFQVAPCFRDEDARADRSPGEFYQLDFEMAFATQEDVFAVAEQVIPAVFRKFAPGAAVSDAPFVRIPYKQCMLEFGSDKPDLRNPLRIVDLSDIFATSSFAPFRNKTVRGICVPGAASQPRSFFEGMLAFATGIGMKGLGYIKVTDEMTFLGPIDKFIPDDQRPVLIERAGLKPGCVLYFIGDTAANAPLLAGQIRNELGRRLDLLEKNAYRFCFVTDFPMYEQDEETGKIIFTHNPFSMPQGGLDALLHKDPLDILAYQYDIVCNGVELSSGAVRNHDVEIMKKAFEIAGYTEDDLKQKFSSLYNAFQYGAPPHAGMAPGIDRMIMLLTGDQNIREIILFPLNSNAQDTMLGAPGTVTEQQLREVHIKLR